MSLGKLPVIKSLVSNSSGKRRFKNDLTPDMISPPLGDFRHTMHVGRGGDVFGDTSFLSNHGGDQDASKSNFLLRTFRYVRKSPARGRNSLKETSTPPPPISPIIKNAISLPHISDGFNGSLETIAFKSTPASPSNMTNSYGLSWNNFQFQALLHSRTIVNYVCISEVFNILHQYLKCMPLSDSVPN